MKAVIPSMQKASGGSIVNISSMNGIVLALKKSLFKNYCS
jgi:short-subunit dehydrogenase